MANRTRDIRLRFRVTQEERDMIEAKMEQFGTTNMAAYLRKMAIDGYVVRLELPEIRDMVSLLRKISSNINQIAKRVNQTDRLYQAEIAEIQQKQEEIWQAVKEILAKLARIP